MANDINQNLAVFLTSCRESALHELAENNSEYRKLLAGMGEFWKRIQNMCPDEHEAMIDNFYALARMEKNHLYLQGFRDCIRLCKRFDCSFVESQEFEKFFV